MNEVTVNKLAHFSRWKGVYHLIWFSFKHALGVQRFPDLIFCVSAVSLSASSAYIIGFSYRIFKK